MTIGTSVLTTDGCRTSSRRVGEVPETTSAWHACADRIGDLLTATA